MRPDGAGRTEVLNHLDYLGNPQIGYIYSYNDAGDLLSKSDHGLVKTYDYDEHGQLTSDDGTTYSYDLNGNRTNPGYIPGPGNRIVSDGVWNYSYDPEGNITKKVQLVAGQPTGIAWTYFYDHKSHLTRAERRTTDGGYLELSADYAYDAFGNRIAKAVDWDGAGANPAEIQRYALDGWNRAKASPIGNETWDVFADLTATGSLTTRYLRGDVVDEVFARAESGFEYWYLNDNQGSMREVVDASGLIKDQITYDAFGNILSETAPQFRGRYAWTGRELDAETGLQYNRARYYDSTIGRWVSEDPLAFAAGDPNLYRYVTNRPILLHDPSGLQGAAQYFLLALGFTLAADEPDSGDGRSSRPDSNPHLEGQTPMPGTRTTGVNRARALEVELVQRTGQGTIQGGWTPAEVAYIRRTGELPDSIEGHHINDVHRNQEWQGDPRNIRFVRGRRGNLEQHEGGSYRGASTGPLIDRRAMIDLADRVGISPRTGTTPASTTPTSNARRGSSVPVSGRRAAIRTARRGGTALVLGMVFRLLFPDLAEGGDRLEQRQLELEDRYPEMRRMGPDGATMSGRVIRPMP